MGETQGNAGTAGAGAEGTTSAPAALPTQAPSVPTTGQPTPPTQTTLQPAVTQPETPAAKETTEAQKQALKQLSDDDDGDVDAGKEPYQISGDALKKRLARFADKQLRELFGTTDRKAILAMKETAERAEAAKEAARRASLSREQQLQEDLQKYRQELESMKAEQAQRAEQEAFAQQDAFVNETATKYIDPDFVEDASMRLARHISTLSDEEAEGFDDAKVDAFFAQLVAERPKWGKGYGMPQTQEQTQQAPAVRTQPLTTTVRDSRPVSEQAPGQGQDVMSMSKAEIASKFGIRY